MNPVGSLWPGRRSGSISEFLKESSSQQLPIQDGVIQESKHHRELIRRPSLVLEVLCFGFAKPPEIRVHEKFP